MGSKVHMKEMRQPTNLIPIQLRSISLNDGKVVISGIPLIDSMTMDFEVLKVQMTKYNEKVRYKKPSLDSPTFPNIVMIKSEKEQTREYYC